MDRVSRYQLFLMGAMYTHVLSIKYLHTQVIGSAKQSAWLVYPLTYLLVLLSLALFSGILRKNPEQTLLNALSTQFPRASKGVVFFYLCFFLYILARDLETLTHIINTYLLPMTPLIIIASLIIALAILSARSGLQTIGRMTEVFFPVFVIIILITPVVLAPQMQVRFLSPIWDESLYPLLRGVWLTLGYLGEIIIIPLIVIGSHYSVKQVASSLLFSVFLSEASMVMTILILGPELTGHLLEPSLELVRLIRISDFLDRFDLPIVAIWLPCVILKISLTLYAASRAFHFLFPAIDYRVIPTYLGIFGLSFTMWFYDNPLQILSLNEWWPAAIVFVGFLLPLLLRFVIRREAKQEEMV